jgi:hypothetical protein
MWSFTTTTRVLISLAALFISFSLHVNSSTYQTWMLEVIGFKFRNFEMLSNRFDSLEWFAVWDERGSFISWHVRVGQSGLKTGFSYYTAFSGIKWYPVHHRHHLIEPVYPPGLLRVQLLSFLAQPLWSPSMWWTEFSWRHFHVVCHGHVSGGSTEHSLPCPG